MKKAVYDKSGRQIVSSAWKEFNQQTNCISTGNVYANTQYSSFIRPWKEKECNGHVNPEGHLVIYSRLKTRSIRDTTDLFLLPSRWVFPATAS